MKIQVLSIAVISLLSLSASLLICLDLSYTVASEVQCCIKSIYWVWLKPVASKRTALYQLGYSGPCTSELRTDSCFCTREKCSGIS
jgi:hypothetical protein